MADSTPVNVFTAIDEVNRLLELTDLHPIRRITLYIVLL